MLESLETSVFTDLMEDREYSSLQGALVVNPGAGDLIPGSGGLRKIRWNESRRGKGKRGGVRVIYYWYRRDEVIYMLLAYSKEQRDDLTAAQKRVLKQMVEEEFR